MGWEERFFGSAPAALTAQVEGRTINLRFPAHAGLHTNPPPSDAFRGQDIRFLDFRFIHGVTGPDGPGLLISFDLQGCVPEGTFAVFEPLFDFTPVPARLAHFNTLHGFIAVGNDVFGAERTWTTKFFLPFAAIAEVRTDEMLCRFRIYAPNGDPLIEASETIPWPDSSFRDAMNAMSYTTHLLVSLMKASGSLSPMDVQAIRRDMKRRYALSQVGLNILKRYLKQASADPSTAFELGTIAREARLFRRDDQSDILEHLVRFAEVSGELTSNQESFIQEFAHHAEFQEKPPFVWDTDTETPRTPPTHTPPEPIQEALRILDLPLSASAEDIKTRYRALVREVHPDRLQHASLDIQRIANERLPDINKAYGTLRENLAQF